MDDFSIDPMAYVPGGILDPTKPLYGASLCIQQGLAASQQFFQSDSELDEEFWDSLGEEE